jgi:hypothetical protein
MTLLSRRLSRPRSALKIARKHANQCISIHSDNAHYLAEAEVAVQPSVCPAGVWPRVGLLPEPGVGERPRESGEGPTSGACLTGCTPDGARVTWCTGLALVRLHLRHDWCSWRGWQRYSTEVQQLTWTQADVQGRERTVTCRDGRGWTCCRQMACKRSAVRARLAPPRSEIEFESKTGERGPREGHSEGQDPPDDGRLASGNASIVISPG